MRNKLLESMKLKHTNEHYHVPILSCSSTWEGQGANDKALDLGHVYTLEVNLGVKINSTQESVARSVIEAERYIARQVYGQYVDELLDWYYEKNISMFLTQEMESKFHEIIESMQGRS